MEQIIANLKGVIRKATLSGKEYLVAPSTLIVPGVLNGSKGPLLYPPEEIARDPSAWNGIPLVLYHPIINNLPVSARSPEIVDKQGLGYIFNARVLLRPKGDKPVGSLLAESWIDIEAMRRFSPETLVKIESGNAIELSTGLFTTNEEAPPNSSFNGTTYLYIARNYKPDHVAILPNQTGACSVQDGCGILVNQDTTMNHDESVLAYNRRWTQAMRDNLPKEDFAGPDQSFPIKTQEDLDAAVHSLGRSKHDTSSIKANIIKIAKRKGLKLPEAWQTTNNTRDISMFNRDNAISYLTTNCECWKSQEDKDLLANFSDSKLESLFKHAQEEKVRRNITQTLNQTLGIDLLTVNSDSMEPMMTSAMLEKCKKLMEAEKKEPAMNTQTSGQTSQTNNQNGNSTVSKPLTLTEYLTQHGTPEERAVWNNATQMVDREKNDIISRLTVNFTGDDKIRRTNWLKSKQLDELREIETISRSNSPAPTNNSGSLPFSFPNYGGASTPSPIVNQELDDSLDTPVYNWSELEKANSGNRD